MGAVQILTHSMVQSIEENSVRKGYDPRDFALVAEGGAGPLFAAQIALEVGTPWVRRAAVPGRHRGDGPARDRHGLRVRLDDVPAALEARRGRRSQRALRGARGAGARAARGGRHPGRPASLIQRIADCRYLGQGYELRVDVGSGDDRRRLGREGARRLPRHPRARVLAPLRGLGHRDPERPRARDRADAAARDARRSSTATTSPDAALRHEREAWFRVGGELEQVADALLRPRRAQGRATGSRGPAIVNQYDSTTVIPPGLAAHVDRFGNIVIEIGVVGRGRSALAGPTEVSDMSVIEYEVGRQPGPPTREARRGRPDHAARARRRVPRDREGDGGRALPDVLLVDHPRVRGPRRRHLRRRGPRALRVGLDADAHRLAALVHPRLPAPARRRDRGRRRDRPQPPVPRRLALARTSRSRCRSSTRASCSASRRSPRTCSTSAARSPGSTPTRSTSTPRRRSTTRCAGTGAAS